MPTFCLWKHLLLPPSIHKSGLKLGEYVLYLQRNVSDCPHLDVKFDLGETELYCFDGKI